MMILTAKVDFKKIMVILLSLAAVLLALILIFGGKSQDTAATGATGTNDSRVKFLEGFGWQVTPTPHETTQVRIPEESGEMFRRYQLRAENRRAYVLVDDQVNVPLPAEIGLKAFTGGLLWPLVAGGGDLHAGILLDGVEHL